jgi:hypothetical protein
MLRGVSSYDPGIIKVINNKSISDFVNVGRKAIIFLDIFYRLFTDLNYKPIVGWGSRPEICQLTTNLFLGNSATGLSQGLKPNPGICLG